MDKETKLRGILFFVIGFLLVLSLVICIYIVAGESKLVPVEAEVVNIAKDATNVGVDSVEIKYEVDGSSYSTFFDSKKDFKIGDKINVYYYSNDCTQVKYGKTSKLIFLCPIIGLALCALGVFEIYRKRNDGESEFKTSVIGVVGNTQQLRIVTENTEEQSYQPSQEEAEVKSIAEPVEEEIPVQIEENIVSSEEIELPMPSNLVAETDLPLPDPVEEEMPTLADEQADQVEQTEEEVNKERNITVPDIANVSETPQEEIAEETKKDESNPESVVEETKEEKSNLEDAVMERVMENGSGSISEADLKEAIRDAIADVIKEAKKEKKKEIVQVRVIPNYYYISGTSLMYEEAGKEQKELDLKDVTNVTRTINDAGVVVKLVVESPEVKCILTNMKNIDLEQLSNLLRNKMRAMDENFEEVIEHKEY